MTDEHGIPGDKDWGASTDDLDVEYARQRFYGKTIEEVLPYFYGSVLCACEDLNNMPAQPFRYYIMAFKKYLLSENALKGVWCVELSGIADGANSFLGLLRTKLIESPGHVLPVMEELMPVAEFVASHQMLYDAPPEFYGSFAERLDEIKVLYAQALSDV